jgi:aldose 1-epimerase
MISRRDFGELSSGQPITRWTLCNESGAGLTVMDLGATVLTLEVPDREGRLADVVLGFDTAAPYLEHSPYFGAVVGRYANRIANGRFTLDGTSHQLSQNDGANSLHGGLSGFDKRIWASEKTETGEGNGVKFTLVSGDGDGGFPGKITASATYVWTEDNRVVIDYDAVCDKPTPFSMTQHSYWNLGGVANVQSIVGHELWIDADYYLPVGKTLIPTGEIEDVSGTPFDFRTPKLLRRDIDFADDQLRHGDGYDHNMVLNGAGFRLAAKLKDPQSGRWMEVSTSEPGLQLYSGNFLEGKNAGKGGNHYPRRSGVALETQAFPDAPNQPRFPDATLRPGQRFKSRTVFAFGAD